MARAKGTTRKKSMAPQADAVRRPIALPPYLPWVILGLVMICVWVARIRLLQIPLERDEGEYAFAGQLLLQGIPPYKEAFNFKFPGVYGAYALIMALLGQTIAGIHVGLLLLNAGTVVLVYLLGRRVFSRTAGIAAAAAYALLSVGIGVLGTQTHATHLVVAAAIGGTLLLLRAVERESPVELFASGLLYGIAILMKQHGVFFAFFGALVLFAYRRRRMAVFARDLAILVIGTVVPVGLTALALWRAGVWDKFWFWTITYSREYVMETSFSTGMALFSETFPKVVGANVLLWLFAAVGLVAVRSRFAAALLVISFAAVCPGLYFREHYFVLMLPALALLAGATVDFAARKLENPLAAWLFYGAILGVCVLLQSDYLFVSSPLAVCRRMYSYNPFPEVIPISNYIRDHSGKDDRIAVVGSEPEVYFYAHRRSATGYIYTYGMMEPQPFAMTMQNDMIHDIETVRPKFIVYANVPWSWLRGPNSNLHILDWWREYSEKNYRMVGVADMTSAEQADYHWNEPFYRPRSSVYLAVFQRKDL